MRSIYVGRGDLAELSATLDEMEQLQKEAQSSDERQERQALKSLDANIDSLITSTLTQAVLLTSGFISSTRDNGGSGDAAAAGMAKLLLLLFRGPHSVISTPFLTILTPNRRLPVWVKHLLHSRRAERLR